MSDQNGNVMHNLTIVNYAVSILPITAYAIIYILFFSLAQTVNYTTYFIPSASDIIRLEPEYQIFSIMMTFAYLTVIFVFYIHDKIRSILRNRSWSSNTKKFDIFKIISYVSFILYVLGGVLLSFIPYSSSPILVIISQNLNTYGGIALFLVCDLYNAALGFPSTMVSRIFTWVNIVTSFLNVVIRCYIFYSIELQQWWTISTVFHVLAQITGFLKFTFLSTHLPKSAIRMTRKII